MKKSRRTHREANTRPLSHDRPVAHHQAWIIMLPQRKILNLSSYKTSQLYY